MDWLGHSGDSNFAPSPRLARRGEEKESSLRATHPFSRVGGGGGERSGCARRGCGEIENC